MTAEPANHLRRDPIKAQIGQCKPVILCVQYAGGFFIGKNGRANGRRSRNLNLPQAFAELGFMFHARDNLLSDIAAFFKNPPR
jgi:hypothetical protein